MRPPNWGVENRKSVYVPHSLPPGAMAQQYRQQETAQDTGGGVWEWALYDKAQNFPNESAAASASKRDHFSMHETVEWHCIGDSSEDESSTALAKSVRPEYVD